MKMTRFSLLESSNVVQFDCDLVVTEDFWTGHLNPRICPDLIPMPLNTETLCVRRVSETYVVSRSWSGSSMDFVRLLDVTEDDAYYFGYRFRGNQNYLARQAFLRSYQFCIEETFKDKLKRSVRRLREESFEEIVKLALRNLKTAAKAIIDNHNPKLLAKKMKQSMNMWHGDCFSSPCSPDKHVASGHVFSFSWRNLKGFWYWKKGTFRASWIYISWGRSLQNRRGVRIVTEA